jgi:hypothetical protein
MTICETTDFVYPMTADLYYPIIDQALYGNVKKEWVLDRTIACQFTIAGSKRKEEITPNVNIVQDTLLLGRTKTDVRISNALENHTITNVLVTNLRDKTGNNIYLETSGPRVNKATIFEVATIEPIVGPFGSVEYYKVVLRRSENQAVRV